MLAPEPQPRAEQMIWFRIRGPLPDDETIHAALLAYLSDMTLLNTALTAHGRNIFDPHQRRDQHVMPARAQCRRGAFGGGLRTGDNDAHGL